MPLVVQHTIINDALEELSVIDSTHVGVELIRLRTKANMPFVVSVPNAEDGSWSREDALKRLTKYLSKQGYILSPSGTWSHPDTTQPLPRPVKA